MFEAVIHTEASIFSKLRVMEGLQEEPLEIEMLEALRIKAIQRKNKFQFIARYDSELGSRLGTHADPIDPGGGQQCAVGFYCYFKPIVMETLYEFFI